jgi:Family of unknown function (DUF5682)
VTHAVYGIRHHGPGSARSLRAALEARRPDIVLIEGPPEADALIPLAADPDMFPPVALLGYAEQRAAFWPFAVFSPEWQAIQYALAAEIPVRFCDLPAASQLALRDTARDTRDPISELAEAAGYDDPERWWEDQVEHIPAPEAFAAIADAMTTLRAPDLKGGDVTSTAMYGGGCDIASLREAAMRRAIRTAGRDGYREIAVVCGAWHVPALTELGPAAPDDRLLRGLPKLKVQLTWIPWTYGRLAFASGYGAGVTSPGWYHHLFEVPGQPIERWLARAAAVLRGQQVPASPAHVTESVRLANALAALRGRPLPGLDEVTEASRAVLCEGSDLLVNLIQRELVVSERIGGVPPDTPMVPLQRDLRNQQRSLRLRPEALPRDLDLDLRKPTDLARSRLLHRLIIVDVPWGVPAEGRPNIGTFRESWQLTWRPELDLALIEASTWGVTVEAAAVSRVVMSAETTDALADLAARTERCLLADLPDALPAVLAALRERAALDADVTHLMDALPALARSARYGDVRGTDPAALTAVAVDLLTRVCAGLGAALVSVDPEAERRMCSRIDAVTSAAALLGQRDGWLDTLSRLRCPPLIGGRVTRLLLDSGRLTSDDAGIGMSRALSAGATPADAAAWAEGFLSGSGLLLVHDGPLLALVDEWLAGLSGDGFTAVLPALRRTFGAFQPAERRAIGGRAARLGGPSPAPAGGLAVDERRASGAVAAVEAILRGER